MFAKGPRFPPEKPSDVPGPGHYNPPEERLEAYKKGAFLEKTDRFASEKGPELSDSRICSIRPNESHQYTGPPTSQASSQGLAHLQQQIETLRAQNSRLLKEHQQAIRKYEDRATHGDATIQSLVKDNVALKSQLLAQQRENRSGSQREAVLRAALEKASKGETERDSKHAGLQRKLQELEKSHADDKKRQQTEVDQLKRERDASRKSLVEQNEQTALLRKQQATLESRTKDLNKDVLAGQAEIKRLRTEVRDADQAKGQAALRQAQLEHLTKTLNDLQTKYNAELQDRDLKLTHQEQVLTLAIRRGEAAEQQINEFKSNRNFEVDEAKDHIHFLREELETLKHSTEEIKSAASEDREHMNNLQLVMARTTEAYSQLSMSSVSLDAYRQTTLQCASLRLRNIRLERRLADREALVEQLTVYCRQASEAKIFLSGLLREAEEDNQALLSYHGFDNDIPYDDYSLVFSLLDVYTAARGHHDAVMFANLCLIQVMDCFSQEQLSDLLVAYAGSGQELAAQSAVAERLVDGCFALQAEIDALRLNHDAARMELSERSIHISEGLAREHVLTEQLNIHKREMEKLEEALQKEIETSGRLAQASHQSQKNEERLRLELDQLLEDLTDATRYKEAHADLLGEVVDLIQRNELAEAEAYRLSKFNAEILGHTNPQQKIFYVDRIRRELAETKHRLLKSTRDREDLAADNATLHREVTAYKSMVLPTHNKSRSNRVRIERPPLAPKNINKVTQSITSPQEELIDSTAMTLDEIM